MKNLDHPGVVVALLAVAVVLVLSGCWSAPFDQGDDRVGMLWANEHSIGELIAKPFEIFPVTLVSFKLDCFLFGPPESVTPREAIDHPVHGRLWAAGSHIMNGIYALLAGLFLWQFIRRITNEAWLAAAVSAAWLVHPMSCESICWVVERKNTLSALFGFAALVFWLKDDLKFWRWPIVWVLYTLAVFSKAAAIGLLPVFAALEIFAPQDANFTLQRGRRWIDSIERMILPTLIAVGGIAYTLRGFRYSQGLPPGGTIFTALLTDVYIFGSYIQHLFAPLKLSYYYYVEPIVSLSDPRLWTYCLSSAAIVAAMIWLAGPYRRAAWFGVVWFFVALAPNSNLTPGAFLMQDRFTFLAAPGLLLAFFLALKGAAERFHAPLAARAIATAFVLFLSVLTIQLSAVYGDSGELAIRAAEQQPLSAFAQLNAAGAYSARAQSLHASNRGPDQTQWRALAEAALTHYRLAQQCPEFKNYDSPVDFHNCIAEVYMMLGNYEAVLKTLDGLLPPQNMTLLPDKEGWIRPELHSGYMRASLITTWKLACQASLMESIQPPLSNERRLELCNEALHAIDEAAKLRADDDTALLKARVLLALSITEPSLESRRQRYDAAAELLNSLKKPPQSNVAQNLLKTNKRP